MACGIWPLFLASSIGLPQFIAPARSLPIS